MTNRKRWWLGAVVLMAALLTGVAIYQSIRHDAVLQSRLKQLVPASAVTQVDCTLVTSGRPYVLLALGQSNAGNHGTPDSMAMPPITVVTGGKCVRASDPLPDATGTGASIWPRLVARMLRNPLQRPIVVSLLAMESSTIDEWTRKRSPLRERLVQQLDALKLLGLLPNAILWQQGEADARDATSTVDYAARLDLLDNLLTEAGIRAPVYLARSTVCRTPANLPIRSAVDTKITQGGRWLSGPDTDTLNGNRFRHDGCHFSSAGLDAAAQMWAQTLGSAALAK